MVRIRSRSFKGGNLFLRELSGKEIRFYLDWFHNLFRPLNAFVFENFYENLKGNFDELSHQTPNRSFPELSEFNIMTHWVGFLKNINEIEHLRQLDALLPDVHRLKHNLR